MRRHPWSAATRATVTGERSSHSSVAWSRSWSWLGNSRTRLLAAVVGVSLLAFTPAAVANVAGLSLGDSPAGGPLHSVIVSGQSAAAVRADVLGSAGTVDRDLGVVKGVVANVTDGQLAALEADPSVTVSANLPVVVTQVAPAPATPAPSPAPAPPAPAPPAPTRAPAAVFPQVTAAESGLRH